MASGILIIGFTVAGVRWEPETIKLSSFVNAYPLGCSVMREASKATNVMTI